MILAPVKPREKCRRENGVGYCPFPALGHDAAGGVAARKAKLCVGLRTCMHNRPAGRTVTRMTVLAGRRDRASVLATWF